MLYETWLSPASQKIVDFLVPMENFTFETLKATYDKFVADGVGMEFVRQISNKFSVDHAGEEESVRSTEDFFIDSINDGYRIPTRLYSSEVGHESGILLFVHGGGGIQGDLDTHDRFCRRLVKALGTDVLALDYRLAPEFRFPIQLKDVLSAYIWCVKKKGRSSRIIIAGDSAGGNLCAALCLKLHEILYDRKPDVQILFYAALTSNFESPSFNVFRRGYALTVDWIKYYNYLYTGEKLNNPDVSNNKYVYPLLAEDPGIFPRTIVVSAGCDILLDGQLEFIKKLESVNVPVHNINVAGAIHGFMNYGKEFGNEISEVMFSLAKLLR
ncbi:MAG: alpha/beta hydrolase [Holosporales bacterium]|jgi:acetyl esterase|nr:alpha/beta hydrolase [Holosporales bacterium]